METIWPCLRDILLPNAGGSPCAAICDLMDSASDYTSNLDELIDLAEETLKTGRLFVCSSTFEAQARR